MFYAVLIPLFNTLISLNLIHSIRAFRIIELEVNQVIILVFYFI